MYIWYIWYTELKIQYLSVYQSRLDWYTNSGDWYTDETMEPQRPTL